MIWTSAEKGRLLPQGFPAEITQNLEGGSVRK